MLIRVCGKCGSLKIEYLGNDECWCYDCNQKQDCHNILDECCCEEKDNDVSESEVE